MKLFKQGEPSENFVVVRNIVRKYLEDTSVQKLISPLSQEYYIIDGVNNISIEVAQGKVSISNHKFLYKQDFPLKDTEALIREINVAIEKERQELRKTLFANEMDLLNNILNL